jgi:hypothetical protein
MAFELDYTVATAHYVLLALYNLATIAGILAVWFGADDLVRWSMSKKWFRNASTFSFFIYGLHVPLMIYAMTFAAQYLQHLPNYRLLCYIFIPALTVFFAIAMAKVVRKLSPGVYKLMTGGRGLN